MRGRGGEGKNKNTIYANNNTDTYIPPPPLSTEYRPPHPPPQYTDPNRGLHVEGGGGGVSCVLSGEGDRWGVGMTNNEQKCQRK